MGEIQVRQEEGKKGWSGGQAMAGDIMLEMRWGALCIGPARTRDTWQEVLL